jgi:cobalamin biosynthesis protein CobC
MADFCEEPGGIAEVGLEAYRRRRQRKGEERYMHDGFSTLPLDLAFTEHGGNLAAARRAFPSAPEPWLDLSTGISPHPYPFPPLPPEAFTRLPEEGAIRGLERLAAEIYGAGDAACVVAAPGSQAIIQWLPRLLPARKVGVLGVTYGEYAHCFAAADAQIMAFEDLDAMAAMDLAIVVNPNNPDGRCVAVDELLQLARRLSAHGGVLVVDEAFADFLPPSASIVPGLPAEGIIALRSFGKSFGLAGVRLGFAAAWPPLARALRRALGPWAVSGAAVVIGTSAFADRAWCQATERRLAADAAALDRLLGQVGFTRIGGTSLFRLVAHPRAHEIFLSLARAGILVRAFAGRRDWLRFGIPGNAEDCERLAMALAAKQRV